MFTPEGYLTIQEVRRRVKSSYWSATKDRSSRDAFEEFVFYSISLNGGLHICSPSGTIFRLQELPLLTRLDARYLSEIGVFETADIFYDFRKSEIRSSFNFWAIPLFFTRPEYVVSNRNLVDLLGLVETKKPKLANELRQIFWKDWELLEQFSGHSLIAKETSGLTNLEMDESFDPNSGELFYDFDSPQDLQKNGNRGRPRKQEQAKDAYNVLYPKGHEHAGESYKEVANKISDFLGHRVEADTIRRALGKKK